MRRSRKQRGTTRATTREIQISIAWRLRTSWRAVGLLRRVACATAAAEGFDTGQLSIAVVGARAMSTLHARYLGRPVPTDVLSFDLGTDLRRHVVDGEVILCADVARRQTARSDATLTAARAELALYLVHGILHLAGYEDRTPRDYARMHVREDALLQELGLGPVFRTGHG